MMKFDPLMNSVNIELLKKLFYAVLSVKLVRLVPANYPFIICTPLGNKLIINSSTISLKSKCIFVGNSCCQSLSGTLINEYVRV